MILFDLNLILTIRLAHNFNVLFQFCIYFVCIIISVFIFYIHGEIKIETNIEGTDENVECNVH